MPKSPKKCLLGTNKVQNVPAAFLLGTNHVLNEPKSPKKCLLGTNRVQNVPAAFLPGTNQASNVPKFPKKCLVGTNQASNVPATPPDHAPSPRAPGPRTLRALRHPKSAAAVSNRLLRATQKYTPYLISSAFLGLQLSSIALLRLCRWR